ncbi:lipocalin-like isoform X1 [Pseudoliparis swirei]|uniref:lipocalin-like isoform X1 n=1 Tax=Pseudoliparis swirei TaxID=2059687 RepID=UPI0024BDDC16|nr:lipocalin-like isoform X1 [Pseudoliparis swirei]
MALTSCVCACPQVAGNWYLIGFATNAQWFVNRRASMNVGVAILTPTADGDLEISYSSLSADGSCWRLNHLAKKAEVPGKFTYTSWGKVNDLYMVEVKYDEYTLTHTVKSKDSNPTAVIKLYSRAVDLRADLLEKFKQFSLKAGILPENIAFLPKSGEFHINRGSITSD